MPKATSIGTKIRIAREKRGLSQADLAALTGIERAHISRVESGVCQPRLDTLAKLAKGLRTSTVSLLAA